MIGARRGRQRTGGTSGEQKYLGELQAAIMEIMWDRGPATVREVVAALQSHRGSAYTTVMTVMGRLAEQHVLVRERIGKTDWYRPVRTREQFRADISGAIVDDLVADFGDVALAQFADALRLADPDRLARLRDILEKGTADEGA